MAIALDAAVAPASSSGTSLTISLSVGAGPQRQLRAQFFAAGGDIGTGAKCNGVAMTLIGKANTGGGGGNWIYVYGLINPAPGANSIVFTCSASSGYLVGTAASYTGASQTTLTEAVATVFSAVTSLTGTVTTVTSNAWLTFGGSFDGGSIGQGNCDAGTTMRASAVAGGWLCDKGPVVAPGATSITLTVGVAGNWGGVISAMPASVTGAALAAAPSFALATLAPLSLPRVTANRPDVGPGGPVSAVFTEGRGDGSDWIALYALSAPIGDANFVDWFYTTGTKLTGPSGANVSGTIPFTAPLLPGLYEFRFHFQNSYTLVARSAPFAVGGFVGGTGYAASVLADAPLGYWRLNEVTGSAAVADSSGNARPGTVVGGVTLGQPGALPDGTLAAQFSGAGSTGITITPPPAIPALVTIEAWIKPTAFGPAAFNYIWASGSAISFPCEFAIHGSQLSFFINFTTLTPGWISTGYVPTLDVWAHVALTWDGVTLRVFVNGAEIYANAAWAGLTIVNAGTTGGVRSIGWQGPTNDQAFNGYLDDVSYYDRALPPQRIADHVAARTGLTAIRFSTTAIFNAVSFATTPTIRLSAAASLTATGRFAAAAGIQFSTAAMFAVARFITTPIFRVTTNATLTTGTETAHASRVRILLAGVDARTRIAGLTIRDVLNDAPNSCSLTIDGVEQPVCEQAVRVTLNLDAPRLLFNGALQTVDLSYEGWPPTQRVYPCTAIDDTAQANRRRPFGTWANVSATIFAQQLIAKFAPGVTTVHVQADLPPVTITLDGTEGMSGALKQAATQIGGYFYFEDDDLHLFIEEVTDTPDPIDGSPGRLESDPPIKVSRDDSQLRTRQCGRAHGENLIADVAPGETILPVENAAAWFGTTGSGQRAIMGGQLLTYNGLQSAPGGSLVGPGAGPSVGPNVLAVGGAGLADGVYKYAYTDVTASGESIPSPLATAIAGSVTAGLIADPTAAPFGGDVTFPGPILPAGGYTYGVTFTNGVGETRQGPTVLVAWGVINPPVLSLSAGYVTATFVGGGSLPTYQYFIHAMTFLADGGETQSSASIGSFMTGFPNQALVLGNLPTSGGNPRITGRKLYRSFDGGSSWRLIATLNTTDTTFTDTGASGSAATLPANTTARAQVQVTGIPIGPAGTTGRRLYRNGLLVGTLGNNSATTFNDSNTAPGAAAPTTNTTASTGPVNIVNVSGVALGAAGTTSRRVYRTAANGVQLKLLGTIPNNTSTVYGNDIAADGTLGANVPTADTSGLGGSAVAGTVLAGSTTLPTSGTAPFNAASALTRPDPPSVVLLAGAGIESGVHQWALSFVTAAGETLPSGVTAQTCGPVSIAAPSIAPTPLKPFAGAGPDIGSHTYAITFVTAAGETTPGPSSAAVVTSVLDPPPYPPTLHATGAGGSMAPGTYDYVVTFTNDAGQTTPSPVSAPYVLAAPNVAIALTDITGANDATSRRLWRRVNGGPWGLVYTLATADPSTLTDTLATPNFGVGVPPSVNTALFQKIALTTIPLGPAGTISRKVYGTAAGGSQLKLAATIADNVAVSLYVTTPDAALGANAPTINTTPINQNQAQVVFGIGPPNVTGRKLYRTVAGGSQLKLHSTTPHNGGTVSVIDSTPDAGLGANAPTVDTSGGLGVFGGWAIIGNNQAVRYSGIAGNNLTGIPSSGPGALLTSVVYGTQVLPAPTLTGVSGVVLLTPKGTPVNIWVQRDDLGAQQEQAIVDVANGLAPADGIYEGPPLVDERRNETSMAALCDATLAQSSRPIVTVRYDCRDVKTKSGKTIVIDLVDPPIHETLTIQEVTISEIDIAPGLLPRFSVVASSARFSLDDIIRRLLASTDATQTTA